MLKLAVQWVPTAVRFSSDQGMPNSCSHPALLSGVEPPGPHQQICRHCGCNAASQARGCGVNAASMPGAWRMTAAPPRQPAPCISTAQCNTSTLPRFFTTGLEVCCLPGCPHTCNKRTRAPSNPQLLPSHPRAQSRTRAVTLAGAPLALSLSKTTPHPQLQGFP